MYQGLSDAEIEEQLEVFKLDDNPWVLFCTGIVRSDILIFR